MPYIKQERRDTYRVFEGTQFQGPGDLNYVFTKVLNAYVEQYGLKYQVINDVVGALEGAKLEFYRRVAAPYEDGKIKENGDVY